MTSRCLDSVPDIHSCTYLMLENAQLKKKLHKLKNENKTLKEQLEEITEKQKIENLMRQYVTTHNMSTQTEPNRATISSLQIQRKKESEKQLESERTNKLLAMHNGLMRRYEKELKTGMQHVETITELQLKVNSLEQKLKEATLRAQEEESKRRYKRSSSARYRGSPGYSSDEETEVLRLKESIRKLRKEKSKVCEDNKKIKAELKGLDAGFFEEIEDLKFALQQSAQLNRRYEQSLRRVCAKFGLPYPNPEKCLEHSIT